MSVSAMLDRIYAGGWVSKNPADDYWYQPRAIETVAGEDIDEDAAWQFTDVYACVNKIAKTIATLPVQVYERPTPEIRKPADHELNTLLTTEANEDATGLTVREAILSNLLLWGESFNVVEWNNRRSEVRRITPLPSRDMDEVRRDEAGRLVYVYRPPGGQPEGIPEDQMWYIPGLSCNGITGLSPIAYNREAIGMGRAATKFRSAFFGNGAWAGGFITRPTEAPEWSEDKAQEWLNSLNEKFRGAGKAFGLGLLRENMEFKQLDMPFEDAMFLGTARLTRMQICGLFDVPLIKLQDDERATYANAEQQDLVWAKDCLLPWCVRIETAARRRFFKGTRFYLRHNLAGVMRGDFKTRMEGYNIGINWGLWSINEVRALEEMNPIDDGNVHYRPLNMGILGEPVVQQVGDERKAELANLSHLVREQMAERPEEIARRVRLEQWMQKAQEANRKQGRSLIRVAKTLRDSVDTLGAKLDQASPPAIVAFTACIDDAARRIAAKEIKAVTNAFRRRAKEDSSDGFRAWLDRFYDDHADYVVEVLEPVVVGFGQAAGRCCVKQAREFADEYASRCYDTVLASLDGPAGTAELLEHWKEDKPTNVARAIRAMLATKEMDCE